MSTRSKSRLILLPLIIVAILAQSALATTSANAQGTSCSDSMKFISDVTIADGTNEQPGATFTKTWRIKNTGTCTWGDGYVFKFVEGDLMEANPTQVSMPANVGFDNTVDLSVTFKAPANAGSYKSYWQMFSPSGYGFGSKIWVSITVGTANNSTGNGSTTIVSTTNTPMPKNFEFRDVDSNTIEVYVYGSWIRATKSPENKYKFPNTSGTYSFYKYQYCYWKFDWLNSGTVCEEKQRSIQDLGLLPATTISHEGLVDFYSYVNTITFGMVGTISGGTLTGTNGYKIYEVGSDATVSASTVRSVLTRVGVPSLVVSWIHYSSRIFIVTYPISAMPVAVPPRYELATYASLANLGLYNAVQGFHRREASGTNWWVSVQLISLTGACTLSIHLRLPKPGNDSFKLDYVQKHDFECTPEKILGFFFEVARQALQAGVTVETVQWFLNEMLPKVFEDFKMDKALIDAILKLLNMF